MLYIKWNYHYQIQWNYPKFNIFCGTQAIWKNEIIVSQNIHCNGYLLFVIQISIAYVNTLRGKAC